MKRKLLTEGVVKVTAGMGGMGLLLFLPAGTLRYANGWLLMALLFAPMVLAGLVMAKKSPELLKKRLNMREKEGTQRTVVALSGAMFIAGFAVAGLDWRLGLCRLPRAASVAGSVVFLAAYALYAEVLRENAYLSRTIEVQAGQKVIDTGLYGVVRHPMYMATLLLFLSMPVVLGSGAALIVFLAYPMIIAKRILNEEDVLKAGLDGYAAYMEKVRWRLVPFVW